MKFAILVISFLNLTSSALAGGGEGDLGFCGSFLTLTTHQDRMHGIAVSRTGPPYDFEIDPMNGYYSGELAGQVIARLQNGKEIVLPLDRTRSQRTKIVKTNFRATLQEAAVFVKPTLGIAEEIVMASLTNPFEVRLTRTIIGSWHFRTKRRPQAFYVSKFPIAAIVDLEPVEGGLQMTLRPAGSDQEVVVLVSEDFSNVRQIKL